MFNQLKHIVAVILFAAFLNLWMPADIILHLHTHEHTVHGHEDEGVTFENIHHHCFSGQMSILLIASTAILLGKAFLNFKKTKPVLFCHQVITPFFGNELGRGPPFEFNFLKS